MFCFNKNVERLATLVAATSAIGTLSTSAEAQANLSNSSFALPQQQSIFDKLPGKKLELNFGQQALFSFSENRYGFSFNSKNFLAGFEKFNFKDRSSITQLSMQSGFAFGQSNLSFTGFRLSDDKSSLDRQLLNFSSGSNFSFKAERLSVDKDFNRLADITSLSPEDKKRIEAERGFERLNFGANFSPTKGLSFSTDRFNATGIDSDTQKSGFRDLASLSFNNGGNLSFLNEGSSYSANGQNLDNRSRQLLSLGFNAKRFSFSGNHDIQQISTPGNDTKISTTSLGFTSQGKLPIKAFSETKSVSINSFKEQSQVFDLQLQPTKSISLHGRFHDIDRNQGESSTLSVLNWSAGINKNLTFTGAMTKFSSDAGNSIEVNRFALQGQLVKGFNFSGVQETQESERFGSRRIMDFSLASSAPFNLKPFSQLSFSGRYFETTLNGSLETNVASATLSGVAGGLNFKAEHLDIKEPTGVSRNEQGISISKNPNAKDKLSGSIQYKTRQVDSSSGATSNIEVPKTINAQLSYKVNSTSNIQLGYALRPENEKHLPLPKNDFSLSYQTTSNGFRYDAAIAQGYDYTRDYRNTRLNFGASGTFRDGSTLSASIGGMLEDRSGESKFTPLLGVSYNRKISDDNFINLQTNYNERGWQLRLEAKHKF